MEIFGQYNFRNYIEVNFSKFTEEGPMLDAVMLHENIHLLLAMSSKWGIFRYCLEKINILDDNIVDEKRIYLNQFLSLYSNKVHEATATFVELLYLAKIYGYDTLMKTIEDLKYNNKKYYNCMYVLLPVLRYIEGLYEKKVDIENISSVIDDFIFLVFNIARYSLNTDVYNIDIKYLKSKKFLGKFVTNSKFANAYLPFRRFKYYSREVSKYLYKYEEIGVEGILNSIKITEDDIKQKNLDDIKSIVQELYVDSKIKKYVDEYLETINFKYVDIEDAMLYSLPNSFSNNYTTKLEDKLPNTISKNKILFYFGAKNDIYDLMKNRIIDRDLLDNISCSLKDMFLLYIFDSSKKEIYMYLSEKRDILSLLYKTKDRSFIVSYKAFDFEKNNIKNIGYLNFNKKVYVYCDRAYIYAKDIINSFCNEKVHANIIQLGAMGVLLIKLSNNTIFLLPFLMTICNRVISDIKSNKFRIKIELDNRSINKTLVNDIELIIKSIFLL